MIDIGKNIPVIVGTLSILSILIAGVSSYNKLEANTNDTTRRVAIAEDKIKEIEKEGGAELEKIKDANRETEKAITEQKVQLQYISQLLEKVDKKIDEKNTRRDR